MWLRRFKEGSCCAWGAMKKGPGVRYTVKRGPARLIDDLQKNCSIVFRMQTNIH
jgi:hypothetical protein